MSWANAAIYVTAILAYLTPALLRAAAGASPIMGTDRTPSRPDASVPDGQRPLPQVTACRCHDCGCGHGSAR